MTTSSLKHCLQPDDIEPSTKKKRRVGQRLTESDPEWKKPKQTRGNGKHIAERYYCNFEGCELSFTQSQLLEEHVNWHNGIKSYHCQEIACAFSTYRKQAFTKDLKLHEEKPEMSAKRLYRFACDICPKRFKDVSEFNYHKNMHSNVYPFMCDVPECNSKFHHPSFLAYHRQTCHHEVAYPKPTYICTFLQCGSKFLSRRKLHKHAFIHLSEENYWCIFPECHLIFDNWPALSEHIIEDHVLKDKDDE